MKKNIRFDLPHTIISRCLITFKKLFNYVRYRISSLMSIEKSIKYFTQDLNMNRVIYIKLDDLTNYLVNSKDSQEPLCGKKFFSTNFIRYGEWDLYAKPIIPDYYHQKHKRAITFRSTYQIFNDGVPYWECDEYKKKFKGESGYDQESAAELDEKYNNLEVLFNNIRINGYKSQKELNKKPKHWNDEIRVAIDRNGRFIKLAESGNHRLAIAQILNIEFIPVYIQGVHPYWALNCYSKQGGHLLNAINKELCLINVKQSKSF